MSAVLLLGPDLAGDPGLPALQERLRLRGTAGVVLVAVTAKTLLRAIAEQGADAAQSWLASRDAGVVSMAMTAGLAGVVLVGSSGADRDEGILVRHCPDLASAPIAMVPRGGGCWH